MKVTIYGGGNIGTQFAAHFAENGHEVIIYSSKPEKFSKHITVVDHKGNSLHEGDIKLSTNDPSIAFIDRDLIVVALPAFLMETAAKSIEPYMTSNTKICIAPGNGGGEVAFKKVVDCGGVIIGLQRVPSVARLVEYGKCVCATGYRKNLFVAALPQKNNEMACKMIENGLGMECNPLPNYLNLTLTPSNPILHTSRLKILFGDYIPGMTVYRSLPLFYEDWDDETTELLFKCDTEVQALCRQLNGFDLTYVKSLKEHYENDTVEGFTNKIKSIEGFKGLVTPAITVDGGYIPNLESRYFTADFNFGLYIMIQISKLIGYEMPNCMAIFEWYQKIRDTKYDEFSFEKLGISEMEELVEFYSL